MAVWCDAVSRGLRSGVSLADALDEAGVPDAAAIDADDRMTITALGPAVRRGAPLPRAGHPSGDLALVLSVIAACREHGGPAAEPIDRAAGVLRARAAEANDRLTQSTQARLSARVMTLLPLALLSVLVATSPSVRAAVATPVGSAAIAVGAALNACGWQWQRRLIRRAAA